MTFTYLILIVLSFSGIIWVLGSKMLEVGNGREGTFTRLSASSDRAIEEKIAVIWGFVMHANPRNLKRLANFLTAGIFHVFGVAGIHVSKYYTRATRWVRGQRALKKNGVVSFFLKDVAESKGKRK